MMRTQTLELNHADQTQTLATTLALTITAVGALYLAGKGIAALGSAAQMHYACWQLTAARAAASTAVVGGLVTLRRGHLALFGVLYGLTLISTHASVMLPVSAVIAGAAAWAIHRRMIDVSPILRLLAVVLVFNLTLTLSGLMNAWSAADDARQGMSNYTVGLALRTLATLGVVGVFAWSYHRASRRRVLLS